MFHKNKFYLVIGDIGSGAGTERAITNLANTLVNYGHRVEIISCFSFAGGSFFPINESVKIKHLGVRLDTNWFIRTIMVVIKLIKVIEGNDGFVFGTHTGLNNILPIVSVFRSVKTVACEHISFDSVGKINFLIRALSYRFVDLVVVLTEADQKKYRRLSIDARVIPNQLSFPPQLPKPEKNKQILAIGRLSYQKGFDILIKLAAPLLKQYPEWKLVIIGGGDLREDLQELIDSAEISNQIRMMPPSKDIQAFYEQSSIYAMTSRFEGLPMVLLESQAFGLPIVALDCPTGPREVISDGYDGYLIANDALEEFQKKLTYLMESPSQRHIFGINAYYSSLRFTSETIYEIWMRELGKLK